MMDSRFIESVYVFKDNERIGTLSRTPQGALFTYDAATTRSLSYTMPRDKNSYESRGVNLHPFFAGLLPEGLRLSSLQAVVKTSEDDLFSLLLESGSDIIGDISLKKTGSLTEANDVDAIPIEEVIFEDLFQKKVLQRGPQDNLSIAGVQPKISAAIISFPLRIAKRNRSYIVKLEPKEFPRIIENEAFFMSLAKECKITTPRTEIVTDKRGTKALLVERFDRYYNVATDEIHRIHQEDACQFLDRYPADKYRISLSEILEGVQRLGATPLVDITAVLRLTAFSYIIGNGDLHAKNISLYENPSTGYITVTPAYDLLSTYVYGDTKMALKMEGRDDNIKHRDFIALGDRFGVNSAVINSMLKDVTKKIAPTISKLSEIGLDDKKRTHLEKLIGKRIKDLDR